jgi:hypothetical protein
LQNERFTEKFRKRGFLTMRKSCKRVPFLLQSKDYRADQ